MYAIVAVDKNWGIGYENKLLYRISEDLGFFKDTTLNKIVIMGYKTFSSLPSSKPLKHRVNIVLSRKENLRIRNAIVCSSIDHVFKMINGINPEEVFIIGGSKIYASFIKYCDKAIVTKILKEKEADCYFPNLDKSQNWSIEKEYDIMTQNEISYKRSIYINNSKNYYQINKGDNRYMENIKEVFSANKEAEIYLPIFDKSIEDRDELFLVELLDLIDAYFNPIEYGISKEEVQEYTDTHWESNMNFFEYLQFKRYICFNEDFKDLCIKSFNNDEVINNVKVVLKKEDVDAFTIHVKSNYSINEILKHYK